MMVAADANDGFYLPPVRTDSGWYLRLDYRGWLFAKENTTGALEDPTGYNPVCSSVTATDQDVRALCGLMGYLATSSIRATWSAGCQAKSSFNPYGCTEDYNTTRLSQCTVGSVSCSSCTSALHMRCSGKLGPGWLFEIDKRNAAILARRNNNASAPPSGVCSGNPSSYFCQSVCALSGLPSDVQSYTYGYTSKTLYTDCPVTKNTWNYPLILDKPYCPYVSGYKPTPAEEMATKCSGNSAVTAESYNCGDEGTMMAASCRGRIPSTWEYRITSEGYVQARTSSTATWEYCGNGYDGATTRDNADVHFEFVNVETAQLLCKWAGKDWTGAAAYGGPKPSSAGANEGVLLNGIACSANNGATNFTQCMSLNTRRPVAANQWLMLDCVNASVTFKVSTFGSLLAKESMHAQWKNVYLPPAHLQRYGVAICGAMGLPTADVRSLTSATVPMDASNEVPGQFVLLLATDGTDCPATNATNFTRDCKSGTLAGRSTTALPWAALHCGSGSGEQLTKQPEFRIDPVSRGLLFRDDKLNAFGSVCAIRESGNYAGFSSSIAQLACKMMGKPWKGARWWTQATQTKLPPPVTGNGFKVGLSDVWCRDDAPNTVTNFSDPSQCTWIRPTVSTSLGCYKNREYAVSIECGSSFDWEFRVRSDTFNLEIRPNSSAPWGGASYSNVGFGLGQGTVGKRAAGICKAAGKPGNELYSTTTTGSVYMPDGVTSYPRYAFYFGCPVNSSAPQNCSFLLPDEVSGQSTVPIGVKCVDPLYVKFKLDENGMLLAQQSSGQDWFPISTTDDVPPPNASARAMCRMAGKPDAVAAFYFNSSRTGFPLYPDLQFDSTSFSCADNASSLAECSNFYYFPSIYTSRLLLLLFCADSLPPAKREWQLADYNRLQTRPNAWSSWTYTCSTTSSMPAPSVTSQAICRNFLNRSWNVASASTSCCKPVGMDFGVRDISCTSNTDTFDQGCSVSSSSPAACSSSNVMKIQCLGNPTREYDWHHDESDGGRLLARPKGDTSKPWLPVCPYNFGGSSGSNTFRQVTAQKLCSWLGKPSSKPYYSMVGMPPLQGDNGGWAFGQVSCSSAAQNFSECSVEEMPYYCGESYGALSLYCPPDSQNYPWQFMINDTAISGKNIVMLRPNITTAWTYPPRSLCDAGFSDSDAQFLCKVLGKPYRVASFESNVDWDRAKFPEARFYATNMATSYNPQSLADITVDPLAASYYACKGNSDHISISCKDPDWEFWLDTMNIVYVRGTPTQSPGPICANSAYNAPGFNMDAAKLLCRLMGKSDGPGTNYSMSTAGTTNYRIQLLNCPPSATSLSDCTYETTASCYPHQVVQLSCGGAMPVGNAQREYRININTAELETRTSSSTAWGRVCVPTDTTFSAQLAEARPICKSLGLPYQTAYPSYWNGAGTDGYQAKLFSCPDPSGNSNVQECGMIVNTSCPSGNSLQIKCSGILGPQAEARIGDNNYLEIRAGPGQPYARLVDYGSFGNASAPDICRVLGKPFTDAWYENVPDTSNLYPTLWSSLNCGGGATHINNCTVSYVLPNYNALANEVKLHCIGNTTWGFEFKVDPDGLVLVRPSSTATWGTACGSQIIAANPTPESRQNTAAMLCRAVGLPSTTAQLFLRNYINPKRQGNGTVYLQTLTCPAGATNIDPCGFTLSTGGCGHSEDLAIKCYAEDHVNYEFRWDPNGPLSGYRIPQTRPRNITTQAWMPICSSGMSTTSRGLLAQAVCRAMFEPADAAMYTTNGAGASGNYAMRYVDCTGNDFNDDCTFVPDAQFCYSNVAFGVQCATSLTTYSFRINSAFNNRLEARVLGSSDPWSSVCPQSLNSNARVAICNHLGYSTSYATEVTVGGSLTPLLSKVDCPSPSASVLACAYEAAPQCVAAEAVALICNPTAAPGPTTPPAPPAPTSTSSPSSSAAGSSTTTTSPPPPMTSTTTTTGATMPPSSTSTMGTTTQQGGSSSTTTTGASSTTTTTMISGTTDSATTTATTVTGGVSSSSATPDMTSSSTQTTTSMTDGPTKTTAAGTTTTTTTPAPPPPGPTATAPPGVSFTFGFVPGTANKLQVHSSKDTADGTICNAAFDLVDSTVICHNMGKPYTGTSFWRIGVTDPPGPNKIFMSNINCLTVGSGSSATAQMDFSKCTFYSNPTTCSHKNDVAVLCDNKDSMYKWRLRLDTSGRVLASPEGVNVDGLVSGKSASASSGGATATTTTFDDNAAKMVCRSLNYIEVSSAKWAIVGPIDATDPDRHPTVLTSIKCSSSFASSLSSCSYEGGLGQSRDAVAVYCNSPERYSDGWWFQLTTSGILQVRPFGSSSWGVVDATSWGTAEKKSMCATLGMPSTSPTTVVSTAPSSSTTITINSGNSSTTTTSSSSSSSTRAYLSSLRCDASNPDFIKCTHSTSSTSSSKTTKLTCPPIESGGYQFRFGDSNRLEVKASGASDFAAVCDKSGVFDQTTAARLCVFMGFTNVTAAQFSHIGGGTGATALSDVSCPLSATSFSQCSKSTITTGCDHTKDIALVCTSASSPMSAPSGNVGSSSTGGNGATIGGAVGGAIGGLVVLILIGALCVHMRKKRDEQTRKELAMAQNSVVEMIPGATTTVGYNNQFGNAPASPYAQPNSYGQHQQQQPNQYQFQQQQQQQSNFDEPFAGGLVL